MTLSDSLSKLEHQFEGLKQELKTLSRIPSIAFPTYPKAPLEAAAKAVKTLLETGTPLRRVRLVRFKGAPPYVLGETAINPSKPTLLLYAHYDVQPTGNEQLWKSPPFQPEERRGRLFGRGTADDKAGVVVHAATLRVLGTKKIPFNIKVLVEGEEEIGSPHLEGFLLRERDWLKSEVVLVVDTANLETGVGTLTTSLRGLVSASVEAHSAKSPLHSGLFGGAVPDPVIALSKAIASLVDGKGRCNIKGVLPGAPLSAAERRSVRGMSVGVEGFRKQAGLAKGVRLASSRLALFRSLWSEPSVAVNAVDTGGRERVGNVVMNRAWARVGVRFAVPNRSKAVEKALFAHLKKATPWGVGLRVKAEARAEPWRAKEDEAFKQMSQAIQQSYGSVAAAGSGATIPFVPVVQGAMKQASILLLGIEDPLTNAHGENESLHLGDFRKAIEAQIRFIDGFGKK